jgi:Mn2+/Fe2+ NRAMP family transporter
VPLLALIGPGLLVAATGVGAGDLATASIAGSKLGVTVLWAVLLGAFLKFVLTEGLARWQLATGQTLLQGVVQHLGRPAAWLFLVYLVIWSVAVGRALASACGVTMHALLPLFQNPDTGKWVFGAAHSVLGVVLVLVGGYRLFERVMSVSILLMFLTAILTAALLRPDLGSLLAGLVPSIPAVPGGLAWTVALLGGVGGTVTLLCYGYWIREEGREGPAALRLCRVDLASGYVATAIFGLAMVVVGSTVEIEGGGAGLLVNLGDRLESSLGTSVRWLFLVGAWGAVMSSLLGVWQSVPYLFSDLWSMLAGRPSEDRAAVDTSSLPYRGFLIFLAASSVAGLLSSFVRIQKIYAILGALFIPMLALVLLLLNSREDLVGSSHRNRLSTRLILAATLVLFLSFGMMEFGPWG